MHRKIILRQSSEKGEEMVCACFINSVVDEGKTQLIKGLFERVGRKGPGSRQILLLGESSSPQCAYCYSWGSNYYCDSQERIEQYFRDKT